MPCSDLRSGSFTRRSLSAQRRGDDASLTGRRHERRLPGSGDPALPHLAERRARDVRREGAQPLSAEEAVVTCARTGQGFASSHKVASGVVRRAAGHATSNPAEGIARNRRSTIGRCSRIEPQFAAHFVAAGGSPRAARSRRRSSSPGSPGATSARPCGPRRGSAVGTRNSSAPDCAAPIAFCSAPPIGEHVAADLERAGDGHAAVVRELPAGQRGVHLEREREAGGRALDVADRVRHRHRQRDVDVVAARRCRGSAGRPGRVGRRAQRHLGGAAACRRAGTQTSRRRPPCASPSSCAQLRERRDGRPVRRR